MQMRVLVLLANRAPDVVNRDELLATLWENAHAPDYVVTRCISELRKALGDSPQQPQFIETIRKAGYRLVAPVSFAPERRILSFQQSKKTASHYYALGLGMVVLVGIAFMFARQTSRPSLAGNLRPLTSLHGEERDAAFSPTGASVVFAWRATPEGFLNLYTKTLDSDSLSRLTDTLAHDHFPAWSPEGDQVAFVRHTASRCSIHMITLTQLSESPLTECEASRTAGLAWDPTQSRLVFPDQTTPSHPYRLRALDIETGQKTWLTQPSASILGDMLPRFSANGRYLAFLRSTSYAAQDLFVLDTQTGHLRRLTEDQQPIQGYSWTPDDQALLFASPRGGKPQLWRIELAEPGVPTAAALNLAGANRPVLSTLGDLVFEIPRQDPDLWHIDLHASPSNMQRVLSSTHWDAYPAFAPNGTTIAFATNRSGYAEIWTGNLATGSSRPVTQLQTALVGPPSWSPDGRELAFASRHEGQANLYRVSPEEGRVRSLANHPSDDEDPFWSPDGAWIYFTSNRSGTWNVWRQPLAAGPAEQITFHGGINPTLSPDGKWLYYAKPQTSGLWRATALGRQETHLIKDLAVGDGQNWTLADNDLYYFSRNADRTGRLIRYDVTTHHTETVWYADHAPTQAGFSVSPDGRAALYVRAERVQSDLYLLPKAAPPRSPSLFSRILNRQ